MRKRTSRELKAMAYKLADEVETRADRIKRQEPGLTYAHCQALALLEMIPA
jgi:hypothetical protein